jgi:hypothetical protein
MISPNTRFKNRSQLTTNARSIALLKPAAIAVAFAVDEAAMFLFYANRLRARMTPLQNYPAHNEGNQSVEITRFPFHRWCDFYSHSGLGAAVGVEGEDEQRRLIKFLVNRYARLRAKRFLSAPVEAEIIPLGHLYDHPIAIRIRTRAANEKRLASVFADYGYAAIQRAHAYLELRAVSFINGATQPSPFESPYSATVQNENMADAAMAFAPHYDLIGSDEIALERFAC